jgi:hypothetical protein
MVCLSRHPPSATASATRSHPDDSVSTAQSCDVGERSNGELAIVAAARAEALLADLARELGRRVAREHFTAARQPQQAHGQTAGQPHAVG